MKITQLHQIEMTSECNLACKYCPHHKMPRAKMHMSDENYLRAIKWAGMLTGELNLAGIGESTLHPEFVRNVFLAREAIGYSRDLILATNGLLMTPELAKEIAPTRIRVWVSLHRPEKAHHAVEALRAAGILAGVSTDPSVASVDWAGQIKWNVTTPVKGTVCPWLDGGKVFVLSDGRVSRCSFDSTGEGVFAHVDDLDLDQFDMEPYSLCQKCHHVVPVS